MAPNMPTETKAQANLRRYLERSMDAQERATYASRIDAMPHMRVTLEAIANMEVDATTNHEQLSALCIAMARIALDFADGKEGANLAAIPWDEAMRTI